MGYYNEKGTFEPKEGRYIYFNKDFIKTDSFGLMQLFTYEENNYFAISNSFIYLVQFLKKKGVKLSVNTDSVYLARGNKLPYIGSQLFITTLCNEIKLVPSFTLISLGKNTISQKSIFASEITSPLIYEEELNQYINTTLCRIKTLSDNFDIQCDLTGGLDSRVILGLVHRVQKKNSFTLTLKINRKNPNMALDNEIALEIINKFDLPFLTNEKKNLL